MATPGVLHGRKKGKEREGMGGCSLLCREEEEEMGKRERKGRGMGKGRREGEKKGKRGSRGTKSEMERES